jgi:large subunit ribosomal protein L24
VIGHHPEKGKQGIVLEVNRKADRVRVEGVNLGVHCIKGDKERGQKGMQVMRERSIHYSNVNLVDPITNKPTRITKKYLEDGTKVRVAKKSGAIIPRPEILSIRKKPISTTITDKCTSDEDLVWEQTYVSHSKSD